MDLEGYMFFTGLYRDTGIHGIQGVKGIQGDMGGIQGGTEGYRTIQAILWDTGGYLGIQRDKGGYRGLQRDTEGYMVKQEDSSLCLCKYLLSNKQANLYLFTSRKPSCIRTSLKQWG